jgi:ribonucleoside-diphosphate reductase beta chain
MPAESPPKEKTMSRLLTENHVYKPFHYPWAYEAWLTQQRVHWLPEEVPMAEDVRDWKQKLTPSEKKPADADFPLLHAG